MSPPEVLEMDYILFLSLLDYKFEREKKIKEKQDGDQRRINTNYQGSRRSSHK
jgi:hypothetical protein